MRQTPPSTLCNRRPGCVLAPATAADRAFCEALNRDNMARYMAARGIAWDRARFERSWADFDNRMILEGGARVGLLRLLAVDGALEIRDLQVLPAHQGRGIGGWALAEAVAIASGRGIHRLCLRVFHDNPARRLYERAGFRADAIADGVVHMSLHPGGVGPPGPPRPASARR